jgi:N-sulfoglucosamine sulfohydrolase
MSMKTKFPISRRTFLRGAATIGAASAMPQISRSDLDTATVAPEPMQTQFSGAARPNIIYIHSHDTGRFLSPYGHSADTPNIRKLATEGVLFRNAFSGAPTCSPSRACLLTGQTAHEAGMLGLVNMGFKMPDYSHHLCHILHAAGYHTVLAGLQHIAPDPQLIGFDELLHHKTDRVAEVAPGAASFLLSEPRQPFFMDCGFFETHRSTGPGRTFGYSDATPLDNPNYVRVPLNLPDVPDTRKDIAGFDADARILDAGVGLVMQALENAGMTENTIVISTTDHGIAFPQMKCNLNDNGWGISMIIHGPQPFKSGAVCDAMISQLDLYPTLCEYLGIPTPAWCRGKSFLPVLRGERDQVNDAVFAEVNYHVAYEPKRAVRTIRYKYIKRYDGRTTDVLNNCDWGLSKRYWLSKGWKNEKLESEEELFDLVFDPAEHNNLAKDPAHAEVLAEMRQRLLAWQTATNDPLLKGPVPLPAGARALSADEVGPEHM